MSKGHKPHVLAHKWFHDFGTRHNMSIKAKRKLRDMRIVCRIAGARERGAIRRNPYLARAEYGVRLLRKDASSRDILIDIFDRREVFRENWSVIGGRRNARHVYSRHS